MTVPHRESRRHFMAIPEAVQLILQASCMGRGGEVFVLNMGEQVRVVDLARDMIRLHGLVEGRDIKIEYTGLRPGEKMNEELFYNGDLVEKYFSSIPPGRNVQPVAVTEPQQSGEKRVEVVGDAEPELLVGFHKPAVTTPDDYVFDVISMVLANGRTSRLYKKLVVEKQLATDVSAFTAPGNLYPDLFIISATPRSPHTVGELETAIYGEIERLKKEPVSRKEIDKVLNNMEAEEIRSMGSNGGLAYRLTEYEATAGGWRYLVDHRKRVAKVTADDVARVTRKYLVGENRIVGFITKREASK